MTPIGVKRILTALGINQSELARGLDLDPRTVRYWCRLGAPAHASQMLSLLRAGRISWMEARRLVRERRRRVIPVVPTIHRATATDRV